jgi:predicted CXXCH cytochrome family protein
MNAVLLTVISFLALMVSGTSPATAGTKNTVTGVEYVGSQACQACHQTQYKAWQNSLHTQMVRPIAKGDFKNVKADLTAPGAPKPDEYDWAYAIGGWYKEERYAFRHDKGNVLSGEYEYNKPLNRFVLRKDRAGSLERLDWFNACGGCHATGVDYRTRQFSELNIGCEACHGPGALHVKDPKGSKVAVDRTSENCGQCHIRGQDTSKKFGYPIDYEFNKPQSLLAKFSPIPVTDAGSVYPDQKNSNRHRQQYLDWQKGKHAAAGVTCTTCHDPHVGALSYRTGMLRAPEKALCGPCHQAVVANPVKHSGHRYEQASCSACHLLKTIGSGSVTTHTFEAVAPAKTIQYGVDDRGRVKMPNSCMAYCHRGTDVAAMDARYKTLFKK